MFLATGAQIMELIIFTLSYEKKWNCWVVYASPAKDAGDFFLTSGRYTGEEDIEVLPAVKKIAAIIRKYDSSALYQQFGRKKYKDERLFLQKVDEDYIRMHIQPYIEKYVAQVLDELTAAGLPLFMRGSRLDNFYKNERIFLQPGRLRALLKFERNGDYTRYVLRLADGERVFYPGDYALKVLTRFPCRILLGRQLFRFQDDFDGQRLLPFLQKREVLIPKAKEAEYFRKFILKNIRQEEIEVQGFEVIVREVEKSAELSLEQEVFAMPVLALEFCYGKQRVPAWSARKVLVELCTEGDSYAFYKVVRDTDWERRQVEKLTALGLTEQGGGCFRVNEVDRELYVSGRDTTENRPEMEEETVRAWQRTVDWVREHRQELQRLGIGFTQKSLRKKFYTGTWEVEYSEQESPDWFQLRAEVVLSDGCRIPLIRFRDCILNGRREYVLEDGTVFLIPEEWFAAYSDVLLFAQAKGNVLFLHKSQYTLLKQLPGLPVQTGDGSRIDGEVALPDGLRAELRPYQREGYEWLYGLYRNRLGGCLADDMGLGKTLQTIALLLKYKQEGVRRPVSRPVAEPGLQLNLFETATEPEKAPEDSGKPEFQTNLVVVPASLVHNWRNEFRKFAPQLSVTIYAGQNRLELRPYLQRSDVVIVTYHTLRNDIDYFSRLSFGFVVADEAQTLKNPGSQIHQAVLRVRGKWFLALSGTPVENSLSDLWAIMNLVNRNLLGTHHFFKVHFIRPILADVGGRMSVALRKLIAPYVLRRTKEEVLAELPELTSELVICEPEEGQQKMYEEEQSRVRNYILGKRERQEELRSDFMVLKALIRLRQIANHPRLVEPEYAGESGKFREVFRMLGEVIGAGHKVLVFSSFVKYLNLVAGEVEQRGWNYTMLTGTTADREREIRRFASDAACQLFLISLKAGGVGLNLTEADYVFILDPWWNLAAENQAVSRAHRMGQKQAVFVYRFITAGTLEEKILAIQERKQRLADAVVGVSATVPLNDEELLEALS